MKHRHLLISALLLVFLAPALAEACICQPAKPLCQHYWETPVVFTGLVVYATDESDKYVVRFSIDEAFRGVEGTEITLRYGGASCSYFFEIGERYLVFADRDPQSGDLSTSICSGTSPISAAGDALAYIRRMTSRTGGGWIFGTVLRIPCHIGRTCSRFPARYFSDDGTPLVGTRVKARSPNDTLETLADGKGRFEFLGVPPGTYRIGVELPPTLTTEEPKEVEVFHGSCAEVDFLAETNGRITGRAVDSNGQPVADAWVDVIPADTERAKDPGEASFDTSQPDGTFELGPLAAGSYLIGVNLRWFPTLESPFPPTYYPGVRDRTQATAIRLEEGEKLALQDFHLPPRLREIPLEVNVLWPNGNPAVASVYLWQEGETASWFAEQTNTDGTRVLRGLEGHTYWVHATMETRDGEVCAKPIRVLANGHVPPVRLELSLAGEGCRAVQHDEEKPPH